MNGSPIDSQQSAEELIKACGAQGIKLLNITADACTVAPSLPSEHKDPFDRMIAAQSIVPDKFTIISADPAFDAFGPEITRYWAAGIDVQGSTVHKKKPTKSAR